MYVEFSTKLCEVERLFYTIYKED